jgi:hypothetical protein
LFVDPIWRNLLYIPVERGDLIQSLPREHHAHPVSRTHCFGGTPQRSGLQKLDQVPVAF